ncbi:MAG: transglutaminase family protein [Verrucomicrobiota bacterium]
MDRILKGDKQEFYEVVHRTEYRYSIPVSLSLQSIRLTPRFRQYEQDLNATPEGSFRFVRDAFENPVYSYELLGDTDSFVVTNRLLLRKAERNPFDFLLSQNALELPVTYSESEKRALAPYLDASGETDPRLSEAAAEFLPKEKDTVSFLASLVGDLNEKLIYEPRDEPGILTTAELLDRGAGSCRDFSALLQGLLNRAGFASRFVSGYLLETGDLQGAEAMHAWTEVYLSGAGWIGLDPTNGIFTNEDFVACAVATQPLEATPVEGKCFSDERVESELETNLKITPPNENTMG